jgi:flavorubredoxin
MDIPIRFLPTQTLARDTYLIRQLGGEGVTPELVMLNTMVIRGAEPVVVDTGVGITRQGWLDEVFALVEPDDVRWIFLSHDDTDHTGNLEELLARCPNATLVSNWFTIERTGTDLDLPLDRLRILNPGESLVTPDRTLTAIVPPTFDSPTTRGLFDSSTRVYWAADSFGAAVPHALDDISEMDAGAFADAFLHLQRMVSPWHQWLDPDRYRGLIDEVRTLDPQVVATCHGPALFGSQVHTAYGLLERLPEMQAAPLVGQTDLEAMLAAMAAMAPDAATEVAA